MEQLKDEPTTMTMTAPIEPVVPEALPQSAPSATTTESIPIDLNNYPTSSGPSYAELVSDGSFDASKWTLKQNETALRLVEKEFGRLPPPEFNFGDVAKTILGLPTPTESISLPTGPSTGELLVGGVQQVGGTFLDAAAKGDVAKTSEMLYNGLKTLPEMLPFFPSLAEGAQSVEDTRAYKENGASFGDEMASFYSGVTDSIARHPFLFALDAASIGVGGLLGRGVGGVVRAGAKATGLSAAIDRSVIGRILFPPIDLTLREQGLYNEAVRVFKDQGGKLTHLDEASHDALVSYAKLGDETKQADVLSQIGKQIESTWGAQKAEQLSKVEDEVADAVASGHRLPNKKLGIKGKTVDFREGITEQEYNTLLRKSMDYHIKNATKWENSLDTQLESIYTTVTDEFYPVQKALNDLRRAGKPVTDEMDAYEMLMRIKSKTSNALNMARDTYITPLKQLLFDNKLDIEDVDKFLVATQELNTNIVRKGKRVHRGTTVEDATQTLLDLKARGVYDTLEKAAPEIYKLNQLKLDVLVGSGLFDAKTIAKWKANFGETYVPVKGFLLQQVKQAKSDNWLLKRLKPNREQFSQPVKGTTETPFSPLSQVVHDFEASIIAAELNHAKKGFLNLVREYPNSNMWRIIEHKGGDGADLAGHIDPSTGRIPKWLSDLRKGDNAVDGKGRFIKDVLVYENGKPIHIKVTNEALGRALNGLDPSRMTTMLGMMGNMGRWANAMTGVVGKGTRIMASSFTSYSPEFLLPNLARDVQTGLISLKVDDSYKVAVKMLREAPTLALDYYRTGNPESVARLARYRMAGAETSFLGVPSLLDRYSELKRFIKSGDTSPKGFGRVFASIEKANKTVENSLRYSVFNVAVRPKALDGLGLTDEVAARLAQNVTINFNRSGQLGQTLGWAKIFLNAGIQGADKSMKMFLSAKGQDVVASALGGGYSLAEMNRYVGGTDSDGVPYWDKISDAEKSKNLIFMTGKKGERVTIPLAYGLNAVVATAYALNDITHAVAQRASGKPVTIRKSIPETMTWVAKAHLDAFNPVGNDIMSWARLITPSIGIPLQDLASNETGEGKPIHTDKKKIGVPFSQQASPTVGSGYKWASQLLAQGGASFENLLKGDLHWADPITQPPSWFDISPEAMRYTAQSYGGGPYSFGVKSVATGTTLLKAMHVIEGVGKPDFEMRNVPILSRFIKGGSDQGVFDSDTKSRFYKNLDAYEAWESNTAFRKEKAPATLALAYSDRGAQMTAIKALVQPTLESVSRWRDMVEKDPTNKRTYLNLMAEDMKRFNFLFSRIVRTP